MSANKQVKRQKTINSEVRTMKRNLEISGKNLLYDNIMEIDSVENNICIKSEPLDEYLNEDDDSKSSALNCDDESNSELMNIVDKRASDISKMFRRIDGGCTNYVECSVCFKKMKETSMKQHFKTHAGLRPFVCDVCGSRFTRRGDVVRHKRVVHTRMKPHVCKKCDRPFPNKHLLLVHLENHDKNFFYECDTCNYKFGKKEYYESHIRYIHPLPPGTAPKYVDDLVEVQLDEFDHYEDEDDCLVSINSEAKGSHKIENGEIVLQTTNKDNKNSLMSQVILPGSIKLHSLANSPKDEALINKMLRVAAEQSRSTLRAIAQYTKQTLKHKASNKKLVEMEIRAPAKGATFLVQLKVEKSFDLQSDIGQDVLMRILSEACGEQEGLEGPIELTVHNSVV